MQLNYFQIIMITTTNIAVVILHYGSIDLTRHVHDQLLSSDPDMVDNIFVLDNNAPNSYPDSWVRLSENYFWGGALDLTTKTMYDKGFKYLWFLNNDIEFLTEIPIIARAIQRFVKIEKVLGSIGIYSPSLTRSIFHPQMVCDKNFQYRKVQYIDGIAPIINLDCWFSLGNLGIDDNPIGYGVDNFFSLKASSRGWNVIVDHQIVIKHHDHSTAKSINGFLESGMTMAGQYLRQRLGPGSRKKLQSLATIYEDY